jgi:adenine-specific DNA-methyltransferase
MKKLDMKTNDHTEENIDKIAELFPKVVTEKEGGDGTTTRSVDFDLLRQLLSDSLVDGPDERYRLDWPGKRRSLLKANTPITKTLRPVREESVDFDITQNLFIEGDNFEALKILQESYLGKVKMIYIDPPYNTGKDFVYSDKHTMDEEDYTELTGAEDEEGNRMFRENTRTNPRFHSDWLSMMYERLIIARDLLRDDGVIFISIDDNEVHNLRKVCDEIFGESNFIDSISRLMKSGGNKGQFFSPNVEYILVYARNIENTKVFRAPLSEEYKDKIYNKIETNGEKSGQRYREMGLYQAGLDSRPNQRYWIKCPDGSFVLPPGFTIPDKVEAGVQVRPKYGDGVWRWIFSRYESELAKGNIVFKETETSSLIDQNGKKSKWNIYTKIWLSDREDEGRVPTDFISNYENRLSSAELKALDMPFDFAKPSQLISYLVSLVDRAESDIILDFFSGSATTAHAVMQQNAEDGGNRKFIMVQLPEETPSDSEASKAGYKNIAELGRERIRRAAAKIKGDYADKLAERETPLDTGFRTYRVDDTNMKDVFYHPTEVDQASIDGLVDNVKEDRTSEDLLTQVILDLGLTLDLPIEVKEVGGNTVHCVGGNALVACLDTQITDEAVEEIAKLEPLKVVLRDATFGSGPDRDQNIENIQNDFKRLSPDTEITIL